MCANTAPITAVAKQLINVSGFVSTTSFSKGKVLLTVFCKQGTKTQRDLVLQRQRPLMKWRTNWILISYILTTTASSFYFYMHPGHTIAYLLDYSDWWPGQLVFILHFWWAPEDNWTTDYKNNVKPNCCQYFIYVIIKLQYNSWCLNPKPSHCP